VHPRIRAFSHNPPARSLKFSPSIPWAYSVFHKPGGPENCNTSLPCSPLPAKSGDRSLLNSRLRNTSSVLNLYFDYSLCDLVSLIVIESCWMKGIVCSHPSPASSINRILLSLSIQSHRIDRRHDTILTNHLPGPNRTR